MKPYRLYDDRGRFLFHAKGLAHLDSAEMQLQVGGLRDTVKPYNPYDNSGTGWTFDWADAGNFRDAIGNALYTYREFRDSFECIQKRGMQQDLSWDNAAEKYEEMLLAAKYQW